MHICVVGGGGELAQHVLQHYLNCGCQVTAVCRNTRSKVEGVGIESESLKNVYAVDVLITMTGTVDNAKLTSMEVEQWDKVINDVLGAPFEAIRDANLTEVANVVVVGSIVGSTGGYGCANYAAAKAGLVGLVRAAANEFAERGICVNLLELGYCNAGMGNRLPKKVRENALTLIPLKRFCEPNEVVDAIDYLGRVRYATGNVFTLAGGLR